MKAPLLALLLCACAAARADDAAPEYKLTAGHYRYSDGTTGQDVNLRRRAGDTNLWLGYYRDGVFGRQARTGFDTSIALADDLALQPSLQAASRGFFGGSANLQWGTTWFALLGWGRTNLKPYYNLNWDPNDAVTVGAGWRGDGGRTLSVTLIADDRLGTGQRHLHLFGRWPLADDLRLTLDLLHKTGQGGDDNVSQVRAWGWSAALDWPTWFVRLAHDPKQNFSAQDANRLSVGLRF
ncbi:hypothetical protein [Roseateles sp.]|uniref:hypothetical protein n=1 Tax=Roseateles sp. TaxID=1971397 RepID=UPI003BAB75B5